MRYVKKWNKYLYLFEITIYYVVLYERRMNNLFKVNFKVKNCIIPRIIIEIYKIEKYKNENYISYIALIM